MPRPNGESEDDGESSTSDQSDDRDDLRTGTMKASLSLSLCAGVVLSAVINSNPGQKCYIVVIDGRTFKEVARAYTAAELHKDVHGIFIPHVN